MKWVVGSATGTDRVLEGKRFAIEEDVWAYALINGTLEHTTIAERPSSRSSSRPFLR